jgi:hypothetical protein
MAVVIEEGRCCSSCAQVLANGEDSCDPGECPHGDIPQGVVTDSNEGEFHHPWKPCPGCGTTDAGTWPSYAVLCTSTS